MKTNADTNAATDLSAASVSSTPNGRLPRKDRSRDLHADQPRTVLTNDQFTVPAEPPVAFVDPEAVDKKLAAAKQPVEDAVPINDPDAILRAAMLDAPIEGPTLSPEMRNAFLRFRQSDAGRRAPRVALAMTRLMRIRLAYPRQIAGMTELEELRLLGREIRGEHQLGIVIFERTGCGKSTLAEQYKLMCNLDAPAGTKPVLHARLGSSGTVRDLWVSIIAELGDGFSSAGSETTLRARAMHLMDEANVELLILDETQHSGSKTGYSKDVIAELKIMLDTGMVPVVLLGTEEATPLIKSERDFAGRLFAPCRLAPLNMDDDEDWGLWVDLLKELDGRLVSDGILTQPIGLDNDDLADMLGEATEGIIGQLMRVMLTAVRNIAREDRTVITIDDLRLAVEQWSMGLNFATSNALEQL